MPDSYERAAQAIRGSEKVIAVTGSGISAESGIPTFRDEGGIWEKYPVHEYATLDAFLNDPEKVWRFFRDLAEQFGRCKPNPGHYALAELEQLGKLDAVVTQNIDSLHQEAGNTRVVEFHGNARRLRAPGSPQTEPLDIMNFPGKPPYSAEGVPMKPDVILFGEMIPEDAFVEAEDLARTCDVCIVAGTSGAVFPAAQIPYTAETCGAFIIEMKKNIKNEPAIQNAALPPMPISTCPNNPMPMIPRNTP